MIIEATHFSEFIGNIYNYCKLANLLGLHPCTLREPTFIVMGMTGGYEKGREFKNCN